MTGETGEMEIYFFLPFLMEDGTRKFVGDGTARERQITCTLARERRRLSGRGRLRYKLE